MAQKTYQPLSSALPNLNFAQSAQDFSNKLKSAGDIKNKPNLGQGALSLAQGLRNQGATSLPLGNKAAAPTPKIVTPILTPSETAKPTTPKTNADGSFTDSTGKLHDANSPEAVNNRTMGSNAPAPVPPVTPPVAPPPVSTGLYGQTVANLGNASGNAVNTGTSNVGSGSEMTKSAITNPNPNIDTAQKGLLGLAQAPSAPVTAAQNQFNAFAKARNCLI